LIFTAFFSKNGKYLKRIDVYEEYTELFEEQSRN